MPDRGLEANQYSQSNILFCPRIVCVCLRFIYLEFYRTQRDTTAFHLNAFGDDPKIRAINLG